MHSQNTAYQCLGDEMSIIILGAPKSEESLYQEWEAYPDSPVLTSANPHQVIYDNGGTCLECSTGNFYRHSDGSFKCTADDMEYCHDDVEGWDEGYLISAGDNILFAYSDMTGVECNCDIYTDITCTTVLKAKTTT